MKAVSTSTLGMSGAFSTAKPARSTLRLCSRPTPPISRSTASPSTRLSLICAVVLMSSMARCTSESFTPRLTPPMRSASFSLLASQRAAALEAPRSDSAYTLAPRASSRMKASACRLMNRSAPTRRAFSTRVPSGTKKSPSRVRKARIGLPPTVVLLMRSRSLSAICSTTCFSCVPPGPMAPGSSPPWPGSSATMIRRSVLPRASAGRGGAGREVLCSPAAGVCSGNGRRGGGLGARATVVSPRRVIWLARSICLAIKSPSESVTSLGMPCALATGAAPAGPPRSFMRSAISCSSGSGGCAG